MRVERVLGLRFPLLVCASALSFTILMLFLVAAAAYWTWQNDARMIAEILELEQTRGLLLYYNEATAMTARTAVAENDANWEQKYDFFDDKLDRAVHRCIENAPNQIVLETALDVDNSDGKLEVLERKCFELVRTKKPESAKAILQSPEYKLEESRYSQSLSKLANAVHHAIEQGQRKQRYAAMSSIAAVGCILVLITIVWSVIVHYLSEWGRRVITECEKRVRAEKSLSDAELRLKRHAESFESAVAERTAELEKTTKTAEVFSYSLAHDLRAPVRTMENLAAALLEDYGSVLNDTGREYVERILRAGKRLEMLINDLLLYTRVARQQITAEPLELSAVVGECLESLKGEIEKRGAQIHISDVSKRVMGNKALLQISLSNLITNALKYVSAGVAPKIDIWTEESGDSVKLFVKDNGIGIDMAHQKRVFEMFERLHGQDQYSGTGLGLSIVRQAVERMNGRVDIQFSEPGKGSCFVIELLKASRI